MQPSDIPEIIKMSIPEKILFLEELWDSLVLKDSAIPVPESHKTELDRRMKRQLCTPGKLLTLDELQSRIERRK